MEGCWRPWAEGTHRRRPQVEARFPREPESLVKKNLRRWWDPNQEFPGEGRTKECEGVLQRVGRAAAFYLVCDASFRGTKDGTQVRREESRGGRSQRGRGESPVRGGRREPWLDRDADDRPSRQGAQGRSLFADRQEYARAQGRCRHRFRVHFSGAERTHRPGILQR